MVEYFEFSVTFGLVASLTRMATLNESLKSPRLARTACLGSDANCCTSTGSASSALTSSSNRSSPDCNMIRKLLIAIDVSTLAEDSRKRMQRRCKLHVSTNTMCCVASDSSGNVAMPTAASGEKLELQCTH